MLVTTPGCLTYSAVQYSREEKATKAVPVFVWANVVSGLALGGLVAVTVERDEPPSSVLGGIAAVNLADLVVGGSLFIVAKLFRGLGELDR